jgi:hypothetical protein
MKKGQKTNRNKIANLGYLMRKQGKSDVRFDTKLADFDAKTLLESTMKQRRVLVKVLALLVNVLSIEDFNKIKITDSDESAIALYYRNNAGLCYLEIDTDGDVYVAICNKTADDYISVFPHTKASLNEAGIFFSKNIQNPF